MLVARPEDALIARRSPPPPACFPPNPSPESEPCRRPRRAPGAGARGGGTVPDADGGRGGGEGAQERGRSEGGAGERGEEGSPGVGPLAAALLLLLPVLSWESMQRKQSDDGAG